LAQGLGVSIRAPHFHAGRLRFRLTCTP